MRSSLLLFAVLLALSAPAGAVNLETAATVQLVDPADSMLDHWTDDAVPTWTVTGAPDEQVQVSLELHTADGRRLAMDGGESLLLDRDGRILTIVAGPAPSPDDAIDVVTLVVCRQ